MRWVFVVVALVFGLSRVAAQEAKPPTIKVEDTWTYLVTSEGKKPQRVIHSQIEVTKADAPLVLMSISEVGSKKKPVEQSAAGDWAQSKSIGGHDTVVNRPFAFPMAPKKTWSIDYVEPGQGHPHGREHIHAAYTVAGWEAVTVPAGEFKALKVECEALWVPDKSPAAPTGGAPRTGAPVKSGGTLAKPIAAKPGDGAVLENGTDKAAAQRTDKAPEKAAAKVADKPQDKIVRTYWYVPEVKRWVKSVEEHYAANGTRTDRVTEELEAYMTTE